MLLTATLLLTIPLSGLAEAPAEPTDRPPNIILIMADDLGWNEVGAYGQDKIRTPHMDQLAREGMRFTDHYSGSTVCAPSRCVLMTGKHTGHAVVRANWENGGWGEDEPEGQYPLPDEQITIAEVLKEKGYATGCFGKWGLGGPDTEGHPNNQGFDQFVGYLCQRRAHNFYPTHIWKNDEKLEFDAPYHNGHEKITEPLATEDEYQQRWSQGTYACDVMRDAAVEFINDHADEPFFLYYPSLIPHVAIQVPQEETEAYPREWDPEPYLGQKGYLPHARPNAAYAGMISRLDREIGQLLDALEQQGLTDNTLVIVTSDNGTTWAGGVDAAFFDSTGPWRGLKGSFYEGGIRVPMIARWPGRIEAGTTSDVPSSFQDHMPTLCAAAGADEPAGHDGRNLLPVLSGERKTVDREHLYWEHVAKQAVRKGRWKALRLRLKQGDDTIVLYDLENDPGEQTNVAKDNPEVVADMIRIMNEEHVPSDVFPLPTIDVAVEVKP
ncbi:MAG: arylsulfatase [Phycisphaerales bacterium]|nr:arylsulfatase [Phycisphaerales bacterium]